MGNLVMNKSLFYAKIFELSLEYCNSLTIYYLDFKRDFDRIFRPAIWKIFKKITLISLRTSTYKDTLMSFRRFTQILGVILTFSGTTDFFKVETRDHQGDIPSLFFFLLVTEHILESFDR